MHPFHECTRLRPVYWAAESMLESTRSFLRRARRLFSALALLTLTACSMLPSIDLRDTIARIAATPVPVDEGPTPTVAPANISTAALVKMRSKLRVGIRFDAPPLASVDDEGNLIGLDVDLARELARRWLGSPNNVDFVQITSNSALRRIQNREVDLALGGLVHTRPAETYADFSLSYFQDGEAMLIRAGTFADLPAMAQRTVTYIDAQSIPAMSDAQIANNMTVTLQAAPNYATAIQSLLDGETDGVIGRWRRLRVEAARNGTVSVLAVLQPQPVAIMLPQNDSDWADLVNVTLSAMINDGFYAAAYQQWFGAPPAPVTPLPGQIDLQLASLPDTILPRAVYDRVRATNSVRIGFNAQSDPLATLDADGQPIGFQVDLCRELARRWFQNWTAAQFSALPAGQTTANLDNDTIDLAIGDTAQTQSSERRLDFSLPVYVSGLSVAVLNTAGFIDLMSLNGGRVGIVQETTDTPALDAAKQARGVAFLNVPFPDMSSALAALRDGQIQGVAAERVTLLALARASGDIIVLPDRLNATPIGIAVPTNDSALRDLVNLTLQEMMADGTFAAIYRQWFSDEPPAVELWPGDATRDTALIAPTPTPLPTPTPVIAVVDTPLPAPTPEPTAVPPPAP